MSTEPTLSGSQRDGSTLRLRHPHVHPCVGHRHSFLDGRALVPSPERRHSCRPHVGPALVDYPALGWPVPRHYANCSGCRSVVSVSGSSLHRDSSTDRDCLPELPGICQSRREDVAANNRWQRTVRCAAPQLNRSVRLRARIKARILRRRPYSAENPELVGRSAVVRDAGFFHRCGVSRPARDRNRDRCDSRQIHRTRHPLAAGCVCIRFRYTSIDAHAGGHTNMGFSRCGGGLWRSVHRRFLRS